MGSLNFSNFLLQNSMPKKKRKLFCKNKRKSYTRKFSFSIFTILQRSQWKKKIKVQSKIDRKKSVARKPDLFDFFVFLLV